MGVRRPRFVHAARTAAVALGCCALVAGAALGLEAAVLTAPTRAALVATDMLRRLDGFRLVSSSGDVAGRRFHGVCYQGWFVVHGRRTRKELGAGLLLDGRTRVVEAGGAVLVPRPERRLARLEIRLACPRALAGALADRLARGEHVAVVRARSTYVLRMSAHGQRIEYSASAPSLEPRQTQIAARFAGGTSTLRDGGLTRAKLRRLRRLFEESPHRRPYAYPA